MKNKIREMLKKDMILTKDIVWQLNGLNGSFENYVLYNMEDFDEMMEGYTPTEIAQRIFFGDFNPNNSYFYFNGYGNLESINEDEMESHFSILIDELVDEILYNYSELYIRDDELDDGIGEYLEEMK